MCQSDGDGAKVLPSGSVAQIIVGRGVDTRRCKLKLPIQVDLHLFICCAVGRFLLHSASSKTTTTSSETSLINIHLRLIIFCHNCGRRRRATRLQCLQVSTVVVETTPERRLGGVNLHIWNRAIELDSYLDDGLMSGWILGWRVLWGSCMKVL